MATPQDHIEEMKYITQLIQKHDEVESAHVDDWGGFSNFCIIVTPSTWDRTTTNRLKGIVRRLLKTTSAHLRECFPPERGKNDFLGRPTYHCDYWKFDIDYHQFDSASNQFQIESAS